MIPDLAKVFHRYFEIVSADRPELLKAAFALRYQVYCVENDYEDGSRFSNKEETDEYDMRSVHSLLVSHEGGLAAGTVRLVLPDSRDPGVPFPIEQHCPSSFLEAKFDGSKLPREHVAEISRFAISQYYKRRIGELHSPAGISTESCDGTGEHDGRRLMPHLTVGLFAAIVKMSVENNITHWYAVMEPCLLRLLTRFGIVFQPIGGVVHYHGNRQPCFGVVDEVLAGIWKKRRNVWDLITENGALWPAPSGEDDAENAAGKRGGSRNVLGVVA